MKNSFVIGGLLALLAIGSSTEARTVTEPGQSQSGQGQAGLSGTEVGHATRNAVTETNYTIMRHHHHHHHHHRR